MNEKNIRITVDNVSKKFSIGFKEKKGLLARVLEFVSGVYSEKKELAVLQNVSFEVKEGEVAGLIGKNGSGKTTLLRIIAGIYQPDLGNVKTNGKVVYLSGLGQGLSPKLTMRENIFLMGSIMGLGQNDIKKRFNQIVEFSGLKDFTDTKVLQFSSGMVTRLNFSVTINCLEHHKPEILLLDEVFNAGGDLDFQSKGIEKMEELIKGGATVIMASHNLEIIKKYCNKAILLKNGQAIKIGPSEEVVGEYIKK